MRTGTRSRSRFNFPFSILNSNWPSATCRPMLQRPTHDPSLHHAQSGRRSTTAGRPVVRIAIEGCARVRSRAREVAVTIAGRFARATFQRRRRDPRAIRRIVTRPAVHRRPFGGRFRKTRAHAERNHSTPRRSDPCRARSSLFSELSSEYGGLVDRSFFELFSKTYPDSVWPVYLTQQTDYSGCTEFGEGHLVRSYREWSRFRTSHPLRYQREVKRIIDQIQEQIVSTCACGDRDSVLRELREFAAAFPKSPVHQAVKDRIKELEEGSSDVRFQCISG